MIRPGRRPGRLLRFLFRSPVYLYRLNVGWLLGHRFLLLTHSGRKSRRVRQTVLEVVRYDPESKESVVVSACGEGADWYRNIKAAPALEIRTSRLCYRPAHRILPPEEAYAAISYYEQRHPRTSRILGRLLALQLDGTEAGRRGFAEFLPFVAFSLEVTRPAR